MADEKTDLSKLSPKEFNKILCESKQRIVVTERLSPIHGTIRKLPRAIKEDGSSDPGSPQMYEAKLFHAGKINGNGRVYPKPVMQANLDRIAPLLASGGFCGSIDHGTGLGTQVIMYRELWMNPDGAGYGKYEIVENHSEGANFKAQCDSGMSVGFSTYGFGTGHPASESEKAMYGCEDEADVAVMNPDYECVKVDAVEDPSVGDARIVQQSRDGKEIAERTAHLERLITLDDLAALKTEACDTGLHWIKRGVCGHVISQCQCESDQKHTVYAEVACDKCAAKTEGMTKDQFKAVISERKSKRPVAEGNDRQPLTAIYTQYVRKGDGFTPVGPVQLSPALSQDAFKIVPTWDGVRFVRHVTKHDELYHFAGSVTETVLKEVDSFFDQKEEYAKYGVLFHRGIMMEGGPGNGKSSTINQMTDLVTGRGDVVFYAKDISVLHEGLTAFRDVEPDRKVVVVLEDADEYIGYQERAFLNLLDGENSITGVCYVATTNYVERFPPRLLRPGRFDKRIHVGPPPYEGRRAYLQNKLGKVETAEEIDRLATETDSLSFGHLRELIAAVYVLKEPKADVLARLKGQKIKQSASRQDNPMTEEIEKVLYAITESTGAIHLNSAGVAHALSLARSGKIDHGAFDGSAVPRDAAHSHCFLGVDTSMGADEAGHYKFPVTNASGDKVNVKGVGTAGHYSDGTYPEIHSATVRIGDAIKAHEGSGGGGKGGDAKDSRDRNDIPRLNGREGSGSQSSGQQQSVGEGREDQNMSDQNKVNESVNQFLAGLKGVAGISLPEREVLPAETAEQIEELTGQIGKRDETIASLAKEVEDLKAVIESGKAEKANAERIAKVDAKARELTKDVTYADVILADVAERAVDATFDDTRVEEFVARMTAKYEKVAKSTQKPAGPLNTEDQGRDFTDEDFIEGDNNPDGEDEADGESQEPNPARSKVLEGAFGRKRSAVAK